MGNSALDHLLELFEEHSAGLRGVTRLKMFGCEAFFHQGRIFGMIWKTGRIGLKFPEDASFDEAMALPGSAPWKPGAVAMSRWVLMPEAFYDDTETLAQWIARAHAQVQAKAAKPAKKPKASATAKVKNPAKKSRVTKKKR